MSDKIQKDRIDNILSFLVIKKLVTPITKTDAYKMGLVDSTGRLVKSPETEEEKSALTLFDKFMFKVKRLLGPKVSQLNNFLYVQTLNNDFYNSLIVRGNVEKRAEIKRITKDIQKVSEKYDCPIEDVVAILLQEEVRNNIDDYQGE